MKGYTKQKEPELPEGVSRVKTKSDYIKLKECKMCSGLYPQDQLLYSMTYKMIYQTETHLKVENIELRNLTFVETVNSAIMV